MNDISNPIPLVTRSDPAAHSGDVVAENITTLKELFPSIVTDGKVNWDVLRQVLGDEVENGEERYGLNWKGKKQARAFGLAPSLGTLRPAKDDSVEWKTTKNIVIEGDNLEVLKLLRKSYAGKVKFIYIDPPYNTGKDFVYKDNYQNSIKEYEKLTNQRDFQGTSLISNSETSGRFHTDWLNMMLPRMMAAKEMLASDGAIFVTLDDSELDNFRLLMNEVFGEERFVAQVEWQKRYTRSNNTNNFTSVIDHILIYSGPDFQVNLLPRDDEANARFTNPDNDSRGPWKATPFLNQVSPDKRPNLCYPITNPVTGEVTSPTKKAWRYEKAFFDQLAQENRLYWGADGRRPVPDIKTFLSEVREGMTPINFWSHQYASHTDQANREIKELFGEKVFDTPKPVQLIERMIEHACNDDAIIMDFFAGSGSTGDAVMRFNARTGSRHRYILVQLPQPVAGEDRDQVDLARFCDQIGKPKNIAELTKERLRRAGAKLRDEHQGADLDTGFRVYKLATSNLKPWQPDADNLKASLLDAVDNVLPGRTEDDLLAELLLKTGIDLALPGETRTVIGKTVHALGGGVLIVCLSDITEGEAEELGQGICDWRDELDPPRATTFYFKDSGFETAATKANLAAIIRQRLGKAGVEKLASI